MKNSVYTYVMFANDALALARGEEIADMEKFAAKAADLLAANTKKAEYNASHKKASAPKGPSAITVSIAEDIKAVLTSEPKTGAELNQIGNFNYTALQIANAVKYIDGVVVGKAIRDTVNAKGLKAQKEYTVYSL